MITNTHIEQRALPGQRLYGYSDIPVRTSEKVSEVLEYGTTNETEPLKGSNLFPIKFIVGGIRWNKVNT